MDLYSVDADIAEIKRLDNSINHLIRSNSELLTYLPKTTNLQSQFDGGFDSQSIGTRDAEIAASEDTQQLRVVDNDSDDDYSLVTNTIKENEYTISSQRERVALLKFKLNGGENEQNKHDEHEKHEKHEKHTKNAGVSL
ncbi:hypothetical protein E3P86_03530 [Wallemia ichthyophaga]|uniref:Uncharacterized protein n=1 Tax=Wallemia ichthyophaga TaxID=245174 RepID=A0A4T0IKA0_WALIC|nr:hypothetical protein E3P86_03530 [Wallemia ichthyophaga]